MKNHIITSFGIGVRALALLALCATTTGCQDEYALDDAKPEWLGESVLKGLQGRGEFKNYLNLMHDMEMDEILDRTGSRTLFAAPDSAFEAFYKKNATLPETNPWHTATSYDKLSASQKLLLAKCSMLNNAITMETLATSDGDRERGQYMRRNTLVSVTDTVAWLPSDQIPITYNVNDPNKDLWDNLREGDGIYLTDGDGTQNMMLFFTAEHMANNNMVSSDIELVTGEERKATDVHVYDSKIDEQDITAQNGYINLMNKVIAPLPNMAEVIRTNGETNIFSHILDRFSVPVYIDAYNIAYRNLNEDFTGKIWTKWYRTSVNTATGYVKTGLASYMKEKNDGVDIPTGPETSDVETIAMRDDNGEFELKYDPAWNAINANARGVFYDMAAMFVPDDAVLLRGFKKGGQLHNLIETYATPEQVEAAENATLDNLEAMYVAIDQVPLSTIHAMVNNVMKDSFVSSVQSKFSTQKNDAQEDLFPGGVCDVKSVKLACNGAVYVTGAIYAPADYVSVAAPAFISKDKLVMKWAVYNGSTSGEDFMTLNYYAYLKAMTSRFTFFLPTDDALKYYYDCTSFKSKRPRLVEFSYTGSAFPISAVAYAYADSTGTVGQRYLNEGFDRTDITGRLRDILESHTVVHNGDDDLMGGFGKDDYYLTKGGTAVKVVRDSEGKVRTVMGGFQIDNKLNGITAGGTNPGVDGCNVLSASLYVPGGNGDTYVLDAPIIPTSRSVYSILGSRDEFSEFYNLCNEKDDEIIDDMGMKNGATTAAQIAQMEKKYSVFINDNGLDQNVAFFNNYNYSVYVPSNEAMQRAYRDGLPTWEDIREDYESSRSPVYDDEGNLLENTYKFNSEDDSLRIAAKITYLFNFIRLHFQDQSVFADQTSRAATEYSTSCYFVPDGRNDDEGNFLKLNVIRTGGQNMTIQTMDTDGALVGKPVNVIGTDEWTKNVMARDISCVDDGDKAKSPVNVTTMNMLRIGVSSSAVVHLVDDVLKVGGAFPNWNNPAQVRRVLHNHHIKNKEYQQ